MEMKTRTVTPPVTGFLAACALAAVSASLLAAQAGTPVLKIDAGKSGPPVGLRYGLMTEEINFSYDGGLYGELVRNRSFKEDAKDPVHWSLVQEGGAAASMSLDLGQPLNAAVGTSLKLAITEAGAKQRAGIANEGSGNSRPPKYALPGIVLRQGQPGFQGADHAGTGQR